MSNKSNGKGGMKSKDTDVCLQYGAFEDGQIDLSYKLASLNSHEGNWFEYEGSVHTPQHMMHIKLIQWRI